MNDINREVARRLKKLRTDAGLSLQALAERSGVSRATLSQIETHKTNPTIAVLWRVAAGLEVPFSELIGAGADPRVRVSRAADAAHLYSDDRTYRSRPVLAHVPGHRVEMYELRLEPGTRTEADPHPPGSFEHLYVLSGTLRLEVGGEGYALGPGDTILFPADRPHTYGCPGEDAFEGLSTILYGS